MKKWIVLIILMGAAAWAYQKWPQWKPKTTEADIAERPTTAAVESRDIRFTVSAAGEIGPAEQVSVKPEINGLIDKLPVDIGDRVKKGELLFTLDDRELQNQRSSEITDIERTKLQLQQAERNFRRAQRLFDGKLIAEEIYETSKTDFELAKNALERSEKELAVLEGNLTKTKIQAPFDCTILTRPVSIGQAVSGSGGFNSGTEVLTIADLNSMVINAHINQADITRLKPDQEVEVTVEAVTGLKITGKVERMAPQATIKNNIKGFAVRILLKDVDQRVRPGMTANVKIPVAQADNVLAVPLAAVFTEKNPDTSRTERYVLVKKDEVYERRPVQIGVSDYFYAEVQSGLSPGEVVALEQPKEDRIRVEKEVAARMTSPRLPGLTPKVPGVGEKGPGTSGPSASGRPAGRS